MALHRPFVEFSTSDGRKAVMGPGEFIGRLWTAALRFDDPRISEAHALVSIRNRGLVLLSLRGALHVGGRVQTTVLLEEDLEIQIANDITLHVDGLYLPASELGVRLDGGKAVPLANATYSVLVEDGLALVTGMLGDAAGWIWNTGGRWYLRRSQGELHELDVGQSWTFGDGRLDVVAVELAGLPETNVKGRVYAPLTLNIWFDRVHILRGADQLLALSGILARYFSALVALGRFAPSAVVAGELWKRRQDARSRWDQSLRRLRIKLREAGVREDLIRHDKHGNCELFLLPDDVLNDYTDE